MIDILNVRNMLFIFLFFFTFDHLKVKHTSDIDLITISWFLSNNQRDNAVESLC